MIKTAFRTYELRTTAERLGYPEAIAKAVTYTENLINALERRGLTWGDVPEEYGVKDLFPQTPLGRLTLWAAERTEGFRLFEQVIRNEGDTRAVVLAAHEHCVQRSALMPRA